MAWDNEYRKQMLSRYKNYVADATDFPLSEFTARNSASYTGSRLRKDADDVAYAPCRSLVTKLFLQGLRQFYADYKFRRASFADIEALFTRTQWYRSFLFFCAMGATHGCASAFCRRARSQWQSGLASCLHKPSLMMPIL